MKLSLKKSQRNSCVIRVLVLIFQYKCGPNKEKIMPWMMQELDPTLKELGIPTLEEIGYDKPELWKEDVYDM